MYASENGQRAPRRSSRKRGDPGQSYMTPPYTIRWPAPLGQATDPIGMTARPGTPYPFVSHPVSHPSPYPTVAGNTPGSSTSVFPQPPPPQRSHQRSASAQGSIRAQGPLIKDVPLHPSLNRVPSAVTAVPHPHPYPASWGQAQGHDFPAPSQHPPAPSPFQSAGMQRQGSQHTVYQQVPAGMYQVTAATHVSHHSHRPSIHHHSSTSQYPTHHRSRSGPPSAASHRYASGVTQPVYGHGSAVSSHTSLNGVPSQRVHRATTPPSGVPFAPSGTGLARTPSVSPHRSLSHTRVPPSGTSETAATAHLAHRLEKHHPSPPLAASEFYRSPHRPALPANYDGQTQTRYVNMLLALDGISPLFNILAAFFTWILLAGFLLFPGTFASWKDEPAGTPQSTILGVVNHVSLYVIAWLCTGIGAAGMIWLWWRWWHNYIWISNRIFIPGCLNSIAGIISTLSSIYGVQAGVFGETEKSTIIVTSVLSLICGILVLVHEFWLIRNLRLEHDRIAGVEMAGKHGEGILERRGRVRVEKQRMTHV